MLSDPKWKIHIGKQKEFRKSSFHFLFPTANSCKDTKTDPFYSIIGIMLWVVVNQEKTLLRRFRNSGRLVNGFAPGSLKTTIQNFN